MPYKDPEQKNAQRRVHYYAKTGRIPPETKRHVFKSEEERKQAQTERDRIRNHARGVERAKARAERAATETARVSPQTERKSKPPAFDADATAKLATRERYADAAVYLLRQLRDAHDWQCNPVGTLVDRHNGRVRLYRLALDFGLIAVRNKDAVVPEFAITDLRKLTATKPRAFVALACAGELEDWFSALREVRAGYVLGRLVTAYRDRPS
jgi:hypothetical protein